MYEISDTVTVLRNGELVGEYEAGPAARGSISKMMGKDLDDVSTIQKRKLDEKQMLLRSIVVDYPVPIARMN